MSVVVRAIQWIIGFALTVVICIVLNTFLLTPAQDWWHKGEKQQLDTLTAELSAARPALEAEVKTLREKADLLDREQAELTSLKQRAADIEKTYPAGIPRKIYRPYAAMVASHNSRVASYNKAARDFNTMKDQYNAAIVDFNRKVQQANELAQAIGTRWYLVPVPAFGRGGGEATEGRPSEPRTPR
jgi:hypothetical protein